MRLEPEQVSDILPAIRERQAKLVKVLSAIEELSKSREWSSLKEEVFDTLNERFSKELFSEARKENPDSLKLSRLSGKLEIVEQYDLERLKTRFRTELTNIKKQYG